MSLPSASIHTKLFCVNVSVNPVSELDVLMRNSILEVQYFGSFTTFQICNEEHSVRIMKRTCPMSKVIISNNVALKQCWLAHMGTVTPSFTPK